MTGRARLYAVGAQGAVIAAATQIGDDIAQAVLMARVGAVGWPVTLVAKAALDVLAAAAYLPLTRRRDPAAVMRVLLAAYAIAVAAAWTLGRTGRPGAYLVYVVHECAWTPLTIHWGVYLLAALDAREARRRLPVMFTAARIGAMIGGFVLARAVAYAAAIDLLWAAVALAVIAASLPIGAVAHVEPVAGPVNAPVTDEPTGPVVRDPDTGWRAVWASPLVRAIAISTALMVVTRYGLRVVSLAAISDAKGGDEDAVAGFLGDLGQIANLVGVLIGLFLVPLLVDRVGVTALNLGYAAATLVAQLGLAAWPGLVVASLGRFVDGPLKDAVKTPLSALFYGAEPARARAPARALVFGAVIPLATVVTAGGFALVGGALPWLVAVAAGGFVIASALQNRAWRRRLRALLRTTVAEASTAAAEAAPEAAAAAAIDPARAQAIAARLAPLTAALPTDDAQAIARGLASADPRLRALAGEVLVESAPRAAAHAALRAV